MRINTPRISLILVNLVPLVGMFLGWSLFSVLFFYWFESLVIGFFNIFKMLIAPAFPAKSYEKARPLSKLLFLLPKLFTIFFFTIHYGLFMAVHFIFIIAISSFPDGAALSFSLLKDSILGLFLPLLSPFISHGISFFHNFIGKREYKETSTMQLMTSPYKRVILMHITLLFGGFLIMLTGIPIYAMILFIILKTIIDLKAHNKEHVHLHSF